MPNSKTLSRPEQLKWDQRSRNIRDLAFLGGKIMLILVIAIASSVQLFWNQFQTSGSIASAAFFSVAITGMASFVLLNLPRYLALPFWPAVCLLEGLVISAFVFLPESPSVLFAATLIAGFPSALIASVAIFWISRPISAAPPLDPRNED